MAEVMEALECLGCGRLEGPRPCVGVCQDHIVELVYASDYWDAVAQAERAREGARPMEALVRQLAWTTPRDWEQSFLAFQDRARKILAGTGDTQ